MGFTLVKMVYFTWFNGYIMVFMGIYIPIITTFGKKRKKPMV
jgi:hypothetical protein